MAPLISPRSLAPSLSLFFFLFFSFAQDGRSLYLKYCAQCHHEDRVGRTAPPLLPQFLRGRGDTYLATVIRDGLPSTTMPAFPFLKKEQIEKIINYIRSPAPKISYTFEDIERSYRRFRGKPRKLGITNFENLIVAVDKGAGKVLVVEGDRVLDQLELKNVHGGVKFFKGKFFVPARDGYVLVYSLSFGKPLAKVRVCVYLRNLAVATDGTVAVSCVLPRSVVLLSDDLKPKVRVELPGKPSAIYFLQGKEKFLLAFRDIPKVAFLSPGGSLSIKDIGMPLEDFFIDPFEKFLVGSSRKVKKLVVYKIENLQEVFSERIESMPHLFSSAFWYSGGDFFFATRHTESTKVSVWRLYNWKLVKEIELNSHGFFIRTAPTLSHLWVDNQDSTFSLIDKRTLQVAKVRVTDASNKATHVEFTPDGKRAYLSVLGKNSSFLIYEPVKFKPVGKIPAVHPAGKYNYVLKDRRRYPSLLGYEVFMTKCWGCHHQERVAFGPSLKWIAKNRTRAQIVAQLLNPEETAKALGYKRSAMPKIPLSEWEIEALLAYMEALKDEE